MKTYHFATIDMDNRIVDFHCETRENEKDARHYAECWHRAEGTLTNLIDITHCERCPPLNNELMRKRFDGKWVPDRGIDSRDPQAIMAMHDWTKGLRMSLLCDLESTTNATESDMDIMLALGHLEMAQNLFRRAAIGVSNVR